MKIKRWLWLLVVFTFPILLIGLFIFPSPIMATTTMGTQPDYFLFPPQFMIMTITMAQAHSPSPAMNCCLMATAPIPVVGQSVGPKWLLYDQMPSFPVL